MPDLLEKWQTKPESERSWWADRKTIEENDYILSANAYKPGMSGGGGEHRDPKEILKEIQITEKNILSQTKKIQKILT